MSISRILIRLLQLICIGGFILSAHGIYSWAHRNDWQLAGEIVSGNVNQGDLFFRFRIPVIDGVVSWMSYESVHSVIVPLAVLVASFLLWKYGYRIFYVLK